MEKFSNFLSIEAVPALFLLLVSANTFCVRLGWYKDTPRVTLFGLVDCLYIRHIACLAVPFFSDEGFVLILITRLEEKLEPLQVLLQDIIVIIFLRSL